ncbi:MAG: DNA-binding transcriptional regulator [Undibacterium sp.]|nr:DNA-binding transcriptional regulator [Opitutaceae bacterium]
MGTDKKNGDGVRKVALLIETSNRYGRDLLYGVRDWMREGERWAIRFTEQGRRAPLPTWLKDWRGDGIIARVDSPRIAAALRRTRLPVVDVSAERFSSEFSRVSIDNAAVARLAAEHLEAKGFSDFAYCGDRRFLWSRQRGAEFKRCLVAKGRRCLDFAEKAGAAKPGSDAEIRAIARWLNGLPKPVAVFACYDGRALQVLEACQLLGLHVPDQVAVLGVDNDELVCELANPPLSSVQPNARRSGYEAAAVLARLMRGEKNAVEPTHQVQPVRVVERQSTDVVAVADAKVAAALKFIRQHACEGVDVGDVLRAVPMSRTRLEEKFKALLGHSPHRQIVQQKIARAKHLLVESELAIRAVAEQAGFDNASYLSVAFRRETGESRYAYRARQRTRR